MNHYISLLNEIQKKGTYKPAARENMPGTQSLFGYQFRHNLADGFPALTTKKLFFKGVVVELLWFLRGDTNIKYLVDNGVNIWNEDAYNFYCKTCSRQGITLPMKYDSFIDDIKRGSLDHTDLVDFKLGDCGFQYGKVWRSWSTNRSTVIGHNGTHNEYGEIVIDQIRNVVESLIKTPESRRHIVSAIDPANDTNLALYWCHALFQFNCRPIDVKYKRYYLDSILKLDLKPSEVDSTYEGLNLPKYYLDCQLYQRSADVVLGVPFNIASYALLTEILAKICNMVPGEFIHTFGDVHIYDNHLDAVKEQLSRTPSKLPKLQINTEFWNPENVLTDVVSILENLEVSDFSLEGYEPQAAIKAELSTGIKK